MGYTNIDDRMHQIKGISDKEINILSRLYSYYKKNKYMVLKKESIIKHFRINSNSNYKKIMSHLRSIRLIDKPEVRLTDTGFRKLDDFLSERVDTLTFEKVTKVTQEVTKVTQEVTKVTQNDRKKLLRVTKKLLGVTQEVTKVTNKIYEDVSKDFDYNKIDWKAFYLNHLKVAPYYIYYPSTKENLPQSCGTHKTGTNSQSLGIRDSIITDAVSDEVNLKTDNLKKFKNKNLKIGTISEEEVLRLKNEIAHCSKA